MAVREILLYPKARTDLRAKSEPVHVFNRQSRHLIEDLKENPPMTDKKKEVIERTVRDRFKKITTNGIKIRFVRNIKAEKLGIPIL